MTDVPSSRRLGWGRLLQGGRIIPAFALVAVASLVLGLVLARVVQPPAASSNSEVAGFITATVERKTLRNEVVTRADASFADAVKIEAPSSLPGTAVVSGRLPTAGDNVDALTVLAEVSGRPIILLPGKVPAYRTLSFGMSGSDVLQLKRALVAVGIDPGDPDTTVYDAKTATAVGALYQRVGYAPTATDPGSDDQIRSARDAVTGSQDALDSANRSLVKARNALTPQGRLEQDNLVAAAQRAEQAGQRALSAAQATLAAADAVVVAASPADRPDALAKQEAAKAAVADAADAAANAHDATTLAVATRAAALADPDTSDEVAAVAAAQHGLASARTALTSALDAALPTLPLGEVAFVAQLPRRVDSVTAVVGSVASGPLLSLSGAELSLVASVSSSDAALLTVGDEATFEPPEGGAAIPARVTSIDVPAAADPGAGTGTAGSGTNASVGSDSTSGSRMSVTLLPEGLTDEQVRALDGANARVTIPVGATADKVLAVPIAAVSIGPGGASRVQVIGENGRASFVDVTTGLVAQGDVEITSSTGDLQVGDKVVVGK